MNITIPQHQIIWHSGPIKRPDPTSPIAYVLIKSGDLFYPAQHLPKHASALTLPIEVEGVAYELLARTHEDLIEYEGIEITNQGCLYSRYIQPSFHVLEALVGEVWMQTGTDIDDEMMCTQYALDQIYDAFVNFSYETARATLQQKDLLDCQIYVDARYKDALNASSWWFTPDGQEIAIIYIRTEGTLASALMGGKTAYMTYCTPWSLTAFAEKPEIAYGSRLFLADYSSISGIPVAYYGYVEEMETMMLIKSHAFNGIEEPKKWSVEYWRKKYLQFFRDKKNQTKSVEDLDYYVLSSHRTY